MYCTSSAVSPCIFPISVSLLNRPQGLQASTPTTTFYIPAVFHAPAFCPTMAASAGTPFHLSFRHQMAFLLSTLLLQAGRRASPRANQIMGNAPPDVRVARTLAPAKELAPLSNAGAHYHCRRADVRYHFCAGFPTTCCLQRAARFTLCSGQT